ncbi:hypothetical protein HPB47_009772 [Ixodes persulcatus]|uniref:Uncharacterized protein n=1 Tax=Ixodes persulcatus TaxID=34615 RepID=A0AC60P0Z1_IXOPE|nr:hypothetical protein HPB47_009772 [Ixodes persulcatus]
MGKEMKSLASAAMACVTRLTTRHTVAQNYLEGACSVELKSDQELVDGRQRAVAKAVEGDDVFDSAQQPDGSILGESESRDKIYAIVPVEGVVPRPYLPWSAAALDPTNINGILWVDFKAASIEDLLKTEKAELSERLTNSLQCTEDFKQEKEALEARSDTLSKTVKELECKLCEAQYADSEITFL